MIENYGDFQKLPEAAMQPEKDLEYKIVYSITQPTQSGDEPNSGLVHIARTLNIYEWAGIPPQTMKLVGVIHGEATSIALGAEAYQQKFRRENPNIDLIRQLKAAGVALYVCGQSFLKQGNEREMLNPDVTFALSALTVLPTCQLHGYALLNY